MDTNAKLWVAGPCTDEDIQSICDRFEALLGSSIDFEISRDESLIGGFVAHINGKVYDSSIRGRLEELQRHMKKQL